VIGLVTHSRYLGDLLLKDAHDALPESYVGSATALAAATEADYRCAVFDADQGDGAAVTSYARVDMHVECFLDLLRQRIVPYRAGEEHPEARLHDAVYEVDRGATELLGAGGIEVDLERTFVLHLVGCPFVALLHEPQPL